MNPLNNIPAIAPAPHLSHSQEDAVKCPTCKRDKEIKMDKPGTLKGQPAKGVKFKALSVKRGPGRLRKNPRDKRFVEFW